MSPRRLVALVLSVVATLVPGVASAADPPGPVTDPGGYFVSAFPGLVAVEWSSPTTGGPVSGYEVVGPDGGLIEDIELIFDDRYQARTDADGTQASVLFTIRAVGPGGVGPDVIVELSGPRPGPPEDLRAEALPDGSIIVTWSPPSHLGSSGNNGYGVFIDGSAAGSAGPGELVFTASGRPGVEREIQVAMASDLGFGALASVTATVPIVRPGSVRNVVAVVNEASPGRATVEWSPPTDGGVVEEYEIVANRGSRRLPSDFRSAWVNVDASVPDLEVTIRATGPGGEGPEVTVLAGGPRLPAAPAGLTTTVDGQDLVIEWDAPTYTGTEPITGYLVSAYDQAFETRATERRVVVEGLPTEIDLTVTVIAESPVGRGPPRQSMIVLPRAPGYWMAGEAGALYDFGAADDHTPVLGNIVSVAADATGTGLWVLDSAGVVHVRGDAQHHGDVDVSTLEPGERVTTIAMRPEGDGYWVFTDRGRALAFGAAVFHGDMTEFVLNGAIVASAATADGGGYWMVGSDGGIFSFGNAEFAGSTGSLTLNEPVVGIAPDPDADGYWLVAADGGIFAFDAEFRGSVPGALPDGASLNSPVIGALAFGDGYLMVASDGGIFNFSDQEFLGSLGGQPLLSPIVGVAAFV